MSRRHTHVDHQHSQPSGGQRRVVVIDVCDRGVAFAAARGAGEVARSATPVPGRIVDARTDPDQGQRPTVLRVDPHRNGGTGPSARTIDRSARTSHRYVPAPGTVTSSSTRRESTSDSRTTAHPSTMSSSRSAAVSRTGDTAAGCSGVRAANIIAAISSTAKPATTAAVTAVADPGESRGTRNVNTRISAST